VLQKKALESFLNSLPRCTLLTAGKQGFTYYIANATQHNVWYFDRRMGEATRFSELVYGDGYYPKWRAVDVFGCEFVVVERQAVAARSSENTDLRPDYDQTRLQRVFQNDGYAVYQVLSPSHGSA
jgi:hypothetical protein